MAKKCTQCMKSNRKDAHFCYHCGTRFPTTQSLTRKKNRGPLFEAMQRGDLRTIKKSVNKGLGLDLRDDDGHTLLHWAAEHDYRDLAMLLLKKGATIGARTLDGWTPLDLALVEAHHAMAQLLVGWHQKPGTKSLKTSGEETRGVKESHPAKGNEADFIPSPGALQDHREITARKAILGHLFFLMTFPASRLLSLIEASERTLFSAFKSPPG